MGFHNMCYSLTLYTHACTQTNTQQTTTNNNNNKNEEKKSITYNCIENLVNLYLRSNTQAAGLIAIRTTLENQDLCGNNSQIISTETGSILLMIS